MNIFVTDTCPRKCAQALDDLRLNKMITETAQLLAAALIVHQCPDEKLPVAQASGKPYKLTHKNHPCGLWARETRGNYIWLLNHFSFMLIEYRARHGKIHYSDRNEGRFMMAAEHLPEGKQTPFPNCSRYKEHDVVDGYRLTMDAKWRDDGRPPRWTNRGKPSWSRYEGEDHPEAGSAQSRSDQLGS